MWAHFYPLETGGISLEDSGPLGEASLDHILPALFLLQFFMIFIYRITES